MELNSTHRETCLFLDVIHVEPSFWILFSAIFTSIINILTIFTAVIGNGAILYIFWKHERLRIPSNILLGSLCISDFLTGLIVQPLSVYRRLNEAYDIHSCDVRIVCSYFAVLCFGVSILSIGLISFDRCLAITRPFRYRTFAQNSHCFKAVAVLWFVWAAVTLLPFVQLVRAAIFFRLIFAVMVATIVVVFVSYCFILRILRNHRRKIGCVAAVERKLRLRDNRSNPLNSPFRSGQNTTSLYDPSNNNNNNNNCSNNCDKDRFSQLLLPLDPARLPCTVLATPRPKPKTTLQVPVFKIESSSVISECSNSFVGVSVLDRSMLGPRRETRLPTTTQGKRPRRPLRRSMREFATKFVSNSLSLHSAQSNGANTVAIVVTCLTICYLPQTILLLARKVLEEAHEDNFLHHAKCNFKKIPGKTYYLYKRPSGDLYFSIISPKEWGNSCPHEFIEAYRLEQDMSWTKEKYIHVRDSELQVIDKILNSGVPRLEFLATAAHDKPTEFHHDHVHIEEQQ
eukprot:gene15369-16946_t